MILGKDNIERLPLPIGTSDWARSASSAEYGEGPYRVGDPILSRYVRSSLGKAIP